MSRPVILGLDPGFASFGWALLELGATAADDRVLKLGVIRTAKANKKRRVRSTDDNVERCREIATELRVVVSSAPSHPAAIVAEQMSFVRSAAVMAKVGMAWGATVALAEEWGLPLLGVTPQELKRAVTGRADAGKDDVRDAVRVRYRPAGAVDLDAFDAFDALDASVARGQQEHPYDALGAIVACLNTDVVRMARQMTAVPGATIRAVREAAEARERQRAEEALAQ